MVREAHKRLCNSIKTSLEQHGFKVEMGKRIPHPPIERYHKLERFIEGHFIPDVYSERDDEILMYEVGNCEQEKLDWLREHIGRTIHMPHITHWFPTYFPRRYYYEKEVFKGRPVRVSEKPRRRIWW